MYVGGSPDDAQPLIDWEINTVPQPQLNDRVIHYAQGKCMGGSSARNQLIYHRGTVGSYERWAQLVNDSSYEWDAMLPYFQRTIDFTPPNNVWRPSNASTSYNATAYSPSGGPLQVGYPRHANPFSSYALQAMNDAGLPPQLDFSGGILNGTGYNPFTIDPRAVRSSSETSFWQATAQKDNAVAYINTQAQHILFDANKTATGVNVSVHGQPFVLSARNEVILFAGVFHSPQLLMVSGVGPAATLARFGIPLVRDSPGVGQGMWDTCNIGGVSHAVAVPTSARLADPAYLADTVSRYLANATGDLTNSGGDALGWAAFPPAYLANLTQDARDWLAGLPADWPTMEYVAEASGATLLPSGEGGAAGIRDEASIGCLLVAAKSRGNVTLASASMADKPLVSTNWLLDPVDQSVAVQCVRRVREFWSSVPPAVAGAEVAPGANITSDADILTYLRGKVAPIHHGSCTNRMGTPDDPTAVVDSHGRVFGVNALRVIDVSSLALLPPGHTQGTTYGHAEKLAADIIEGR